MRPAVIDVADRGRNTRRGVARYCYLQAQWAVRFLNGGPYGGERERDTRRRRGACGGGPGTRAAPCGERAAAPVAEADPDRSGAAGGGAGRLVRRAVRRPYRRLRDPVGERPQREGRLAARGAGRVAQGGSAR